MDIRQAMGAVLTFSMFAMLVNMIKRDHFDGDVLVNAPRTSNVYEGFHTGTSTGNSLFQITHEVTGKYGQPLKLCWNNSSPPKEGLRSNGFVTFTLIDGPEYHVSQVANAVEVARNLGATLVLPEIIGSKGEKRAFEEIYDDEKFIKSMTGVIKVGTSKQRETSARKFVNVKVPYNANQNYIMTNIGPIFQTAQNVRVISYFPSRQWEAERNMSPYSCWATFEALRLKPKLQQVVDTIVGRLRTRQPSGHFVAIGYKAGNLGSSTCQENAEKGMKNCYNLLEISQFLKRIGCPQDSVIYVTQPNPDGSLRPLKDLYPYTFTKEDLMQEEKDNKSKTFEIEEEIIDFYTCSASDVFVDAKSGLFYVNVAGKRIASGETDILVPAQKTSNVAQDYISSYVSKANHPAYACFCQ